MSELAEEDESKRAVRLWIRDFVLQESVIKYWAGLCMHVQCLQNVYKIIKIISHQPVQYVLSAQYITLFGDRYPEMRLPRVSQLIGETQVNLARNFETNYKKYFYLSPLINSWTETPVYACFKGDHHLFNLFPRREIIQAVVAHLLVSAEMEGILFPMAFVLKAALRKAFRKTAVPFLLQIERELLLPRTVKALVARCKIIGESINPRDRISN